MDSIPGLGRSPGGGHGNQPIPVFLSGESPWAEEPGELQSMGSQESDTAERLSTQHTHTLIPKDSNTVFKFI